MLHPAAAALEAARSGLAEYARERQRLARFRRLLSETTDHEPVQLQANLELLAELPLVAGAGATGIGLFRTEFLFMNRETLPDEAAQAETYRTVIEAMDGDSVTIRVLDWGGEKDIDALVARGLVPDTLDHNPALGVRGLRLLLRQPDLFETQLAAILRAARHGPVRVLLPMVTNTAEVRAAREIYERVGRRLRRRGEKLAEKLPPLGIMIETPGAALAADALALEADFFAIGTNDLAMYTLAVDRAATDVASLYDPLHPAVLRLIQFATEAALRMRMPVSVCGEMAANPKLTPLLLGLGIRSFSMNASAVPRVKQAVRGVSIDACTRFARRGDGAGGSGADCGAGSGFWQFGLGSKEESSPFSRKRTKKLLLSRGISACARFARRPLAGRKRVPVQRGSKSFLLLFLEKEGLALHLEPRHQLIKPAELAGKLAKIQRQPLSIEDREELVPCDLAQPCLGRSEIEAQHGVSVWRGPAFEQCWPAVSRFCPGAYETRGRKSSRRSSVRPGLQADQTSFAACCSRRRSRALSAGKPSRCWAWT